MPQAERPTTPGEEADEIAQALREVLPRRVDGREAIQEMKDGGGRHWKQMEWIGFYFEWKLEQILRATIGGTRGPRFGRTEFDYRRNYVWDFKGHPLFNADGGANEPMILNDQEAVLRCLQEHHGWGVVAVNGVAGFEGSAAFKEWHDTLKGGTSDYEYDRVARGAPSRKRKTSFEVEELDFYFFTDAEQIERGLSEGWLGGFQKGMRNSNGSPRRAKFSVFTQRVPDWAHPIPKVRL